jgi:hypothetical protein
MCVCVCVRPEVGEGLARQPHLNLRPPRHELADHVVLDATVHSQDFCRISGAKHPNALVRDLVD